MWDIIRNIPPPPPLLLWATALSLLFRVFIFFYERHKKRNERRSAVFDGYWYRIVLLPVCVNPLIDMYRRCAESLRSLAAYKGQPAQYRKEKYQKFQAELASEKNKIVSSFILLSPFSTEIYGRIQTILDDYEDMLAEYCAKCCSDDPNATGEIVASLAYIESNLWMSLSKISEELMQVHERVSEGRMAA